MNILPLVLFACAGLLVVAGLSSMYATNVTFWKGHVSPWSVSLCVAAGLVAGVAMLLAL